MGGERETGTAAAPGDWTGRATDHTPDVLRELHALSRRRADSPSAPRALRSVGRIWGRYAGVGDGSGLR